MLISDTIGGENKAGHHMILDVDIENSAMLNGLLVDVNTPGYLCGESALTNWQEALSELFEPHRNRRIGQPTNFEPPIFSESLFSFPRSQIRKSDPR